MSLVTTKKRKVVPNPLLPPRDKGKIRVIERSGEGGASAKVSQRRNDTPASRTVSNFRRGSIKIFSIFRHGKSTCAPLLKTTVWLITFTRLDSKLRTNDTKRQRLGIERF